MALPTVPCYWTTRKNLYEQAIVRRRNQDTDFRGRWADTATYFKKNDIEMTKQRAWESESSLQSSMDAYKKEKEKDKKKNELQRRRLKLAEMLREERNQHEAELRGYSKDNYTRLDEMKERADGLRSAREEKRKNLAEEKLYEHWRQNNPDIRKIESEQMKDYVVDSWRGQKIEKQERLESARKEKEEYEKKMEEERLEAIARDRERMEQKVEEEKRFRQILKNQMAELKQKEVEAEMLRSEQEELEKQQWELEGLEERRREMERIRKQQDFGRVLLRQHRAQMRRRSQQIQEELEVDRKILEALAEKEMADKEMMTARREKAQADAAWMKKVIEDQIRVEKAREAELDILYQDEAARMWQKREAEWEKERRARERLMAEVLDSRQNQIEDRLDEVKRRQEESILQREKLLREIEIANQLTQRDLEKAEEERERFKEELQEQMTTRREREHSVKEKLEQELEEQRQEEEEYQKFLEEETRRMKLQGFQPKPRGRQAWM